jgi:hypothetical protein
MPLTETIDALRTIDDPFGISGRVFRTVNSVPFTLTSKVSSKCASVRDCRSMGPSHRAVDSRISWGACYTKFAAAQQNRITASTEPLHRIKGRLQGGDSLAGTNTSDGRLLAGLFFSCYSS